MWRRSALVARVSLIQESFVSTVDETCSPHSAISSKPLTVSESSSEKDDLLNINNNNNNKTTTTTTKQQQQQKQQQRKQKQKNLIRIRKVGRVLQKSMFNMWKPLPAVVQILVLLSGSRHARKINDFFYQMRGTKYLKAREAWDITERKKWLRDLPGFEPGTFRRRWSWGVSNGESVNWLSRNRTPFTTDRDL